MSSIVSTPADVEEKARNILESVTDAFYHLDGEFRFTYLNGTARRLLRRDDLIGKNVWEEFPATVGTEFQRAYEQAVVGGQRTDFVAHYPAPLNGWYEIRAYPSQGGVAVYFQDITERRLREQAYERSRSHMELVVRGADVGVWHCPLPFDELVWDAKVKEHFHLPPDARVSIETFYERIHPEDRDRTRTSIAKSVDAQEHYDIDYRTVSPDGTRLNWIRAVGRAYYDEQGRPHRFDGVTINVTNRKEAELALETSEERYRLATRATADIVWDWDISSDRVRWNEALGEHLAWQGVSETASGFFIEHVHQADRAHVRASMKAFLEDPTREFWQSEFRFERGDGGWADVLDRAFVVRGRDRGAVRVIGAMQDLSARKQSERDRERLFEAERTARAEAERQSRLKDEFLATLSHELRTPLNAIVGWSHILGNATLPEDAARGVRVIARNARAQARIVDDLIDMSTMISGKVRVELLRADLGSIVDAALETARPMATTKNIRLSSPERPREDMTVLGDADRLLQVLWNLLSNAIKFTPAGGAVEVRLDGDGDRLRMCVRDDGAGIPADFLPFVFERFRQADATSSRKHGGLGLGLAIVKQIVELHGGDVRAESAGPGLGSAFTVTLPRARPEPGAQSR